MPDRAHLLCRLTAAAVGLLLIAGVGSRYRSVRGPSFYIAFIQHSYNINPALAHKKIIYILLNLSIALKPGMSLLISNSHRKKKQMIAVYQPSIDIYCRRPRRVGNRRTRLNTRSHLLALLCVQITAFPENTGLTSIGRVPHAEI